MNIKQLCHLAIPTVVLPLFPTAVITYEYKPIVPFSYKVVLNNLSVYATLLIILLLSALVSLLSEW